MERAVENEILFKDYAEHVKRVREGIKQENRERCQQQDRPVIFWRSPSEDKEALARKVAERKIESGLVCVIGSLEPSPTFEHRRTHIIRRTRPCHVLYQYQIDPEVGWMHARIQTWFPFNIQVALNGREWLSRQMDQEKLRYRQQGNCFVWIEDYEQVQKLLNRQLETNWAELLNGFAALLNPDHEQLFMASFRKCLALIVIRHQSRTCHPPCRPNQCSSTQPVSHGSRKIAAAPQETKIQ